MKITIGSILSLITLIGSILIGGIHFGGLKANVSNNSLNIVEHTKELNRVENEMIASNIETKGLISKMHEDIAVIVVILNRVEKRMDKD